MIVIYHSKDLDGYCSGAICKKKYPDATLIGYNYGQDFPWNKIIDEQSIMVDVSLPIPDMYRLASMTHLMWIDHHASAIKAFKEYDGWIGDTDVPTTLIPVLQDGIAACEIAWKYLFPNLIMPDAVKLLGMYDTWRQNVPEWSWEDQILPFQYGMRLQCQSPEEFDQKLLDDTANNIGSIMDMGEGVLKYQRQQDKLAMHGAFECEFLGHKAIMCNVRGVGSLAFDSVLKPEHQLMIGFGYTGRQWSFSLRTTKEDVDVSLIAKQFGGGGHRKAAGFAVDNLEDVIDLTKFKQEKS